MTLKGRLVAERGQVRIFWCHLELPKEFFFLMLLQVDVVRPSWLTGGFPELPPAPHNTEAPTQVPRSEDEA